MGLTIHHTNAQISAETTRAQFSFETRNAKLEMSHTDAKVDIHTELPRVEIDQYECFATSGLMGNMDLTRTAAQEAKQNALAYTSKTARNGDRIGAIKNPNPIPDIVLEDAHPVHEFGLDCMPKARPVITVKGGIQINIDQNGGGNMNGVHGNYTPGGMIYYFRPAKVNISIDRYASIRISNENTGFNRYT